MNTQPGGIKGLLKRCRDVSTPNAMPWIAIGIVFLALGMSGRSSYLALGIVFLAIGLAFARRKGGPASPQ